MANSEPRCAAPKAIQEVLNKCDSPALRLFKFATVGGNEKRAELDAVVTCAKAAKVERELPQPKGAKECFYKLRSRLAINLAEGILENAGICLHPHFGVPMIPGSAVKGITRHAAWLRWKAGEVEAEQFTRIFGSPPDKPDKPESAGTIAFLPALPARSGEHLEVDVLTCHHPNYYSGKTRESPDNENPNPQFFLTVKAGTTLRFLLAPLRRAQPGDLDQAAAWLSCALTENGAGAKTAAGYGWFEDLTDSILSQRAQTEAREREVKRTKEIEEALKVLDKASEGRDLTPEEKKEVDALKGEAESFSEANKNRLEGLFNRLKNRYPKAPELDYDKTLFDQLSNGDDKKRVKLIKAYDPKHAKKAKAIVNYLLQDEPFRKRLGTFKDLNKVQQALMKAVKEAKGGTK